jgi:YD repeat-containing protein
VTTDNKSVMYRYNVFGQVKQITAPEGDTYYHYSGESTETDTFLPPRLVRIVDPTGATTRYHYDDHNRVDTITDAANAVTTYQYDCQGNVSSVASPGRGTILSSYSIYGKLLSLTDANSNITQYEYDEFGRQYKEISLDPSAGSGKLYTIDYTYATAGGGCGSCGCGGQNMVSQRTITKGDNAQSESLYYLYDLLGRLTAQGTTAEADDLTFQYDGTRLTEIHHSGTTELWGDSSLHYTYDEYGRMIYETYPNGRRIEYGYDASGHLGTVKDPFGFVSQVGYNAQTGRLETLNHSSLGTATFTYDANDMDRLTRLTQGNEAYTDYAYDTYGHLRYFDHHEGTATHPQLLKHEWWFDNLGHKMAWNGSSGGILVTSWSAPRFLVQMRCEFFVSFLNIPRNGRGCPVRSRSTARARC